MSKGRTSENSGIHGLTGLKQRGKLKLGDLLE